MFQAQTTYGCLLDRAGCRQSDQFPTSGRQKGLVSSSYSSAVECPTAITDRLGEQQGATQIPGSSPVTFGYRANNGTVLQYYLFVLQVSVLTVTLHDVLSYFAISWEEVFHNTRRGHKRSSGRKQYLSPIQTFVATSCCASSKGRS